VWGKEPLKRWREMKLKKKPPGQRKISYAHLSGNTIAKRKGKTTRQTERKKWGKGPVNPSKEAATTLS